MADILAEIIAIPTHIYEGYLAILEYIQSLLTGNTSESSADVI